jgi:hypothetical protein
MSEFWRALRRLKWGRKIQVALLFIASVTTTVLSPWYLNESSPSSRAVRAMFVMSVFPGPFVFVSPTYLLDRKIELFSNDGASIVVDQSDMIEKGYRFPHRLMGVLGWHLLKYSPEMSEQLLDSMLQIIFCNNSQALGYSDFAVESVKYSLQAETGLKTNNIYLYQCRI